MFTFASALIAECVTPPFTSYLMAKSVWTPLLLVLVFDLLGFAILLALPETLPHTMPIDIAANPLLADESSDDESEDRTPLEDDDSSPKKPTAIDRFKKSFRFITRDTAVIALVITFLISKVGRQSINILLQYVSKRYHWTLSKVSFKPGMLMKHQSTYTAQKTTLLLSLRAGVNIILFLFVLPLLSAYAFANATTSFKDLFISRISIVLMVLGSLALSVSSTAALMIIGLIIYTMGTGFVPVVRSLITSRVEAHHASKTSDIGRLYAVIAVMEGIGSLVAGPGMAFAFRVGMKMGEAWLGLPFLVATVLFGGIAGVMFWVRI